MSNLWKGIVLVVSFFLLFYLTGESHSAEKKLKVPSPDEIRKFKPQPNNLMLVEYANERIFVFQIEKIVPRSECNQVRLDDLGRIRMITQATSQAYEYVLKRLPIMVSRWVDYP